MTIDISRVRDTSATARRADNIRKIVARLRTAEMTFAEIQETLGMSPSGTRKYVRELLASEVMRIGHSEAITGKNTAQLVHHFKVADDESKIEAMLSALSKPRDERKKEEPRKRVLTGDPSRHFHIMEDDTHYPVKTQRKVPEPDPLLAAFFGLGVPA